MAEFKKVMVTIKVEGHVDRGELCKPGSKIEVWPDTAEWLAERGIIEPLAKKVSKPKPNKSKGGGTPPA